MTKFGTEVKFTLPADQVLAGLAAFDLTDRKADKLAIHFFDRLDETGEPWLFGKHVILRVRRDVDDSDEPLDSGDVTAKLRPAKEARLTGKWRPGTEHGDEYTVEKDWANKIVLAASLRVKHASGIPGLLEGRPKEALSQEQQDFLRKCGPELEHPMRDLRVTGPIAGRKWKDLTAGPVTDLRAEKWTWGEGGRSFLEFSLRCDNDDEAAKQRELLRAEIEHRGLRLDDSATTKTQTVLRDLL